MASQSAILPLTSQQPRSYSVSQSDATRSSQDEVYKKPWKYIGYKSFSEWAASDNDFFVVRRFSALNSRVILKLQDDISILEEQLEELEADNRRSDGPAVNNGSFRHETIEKRRELLEDIKNKLKEYSEAPIAVILWTLARNNPLKKKKNLTGTDFVGYMIT
jgi:hypothetical protein